MLYNGRGADAPEMHFMAKCKRTEHAFGQVISYIQGLPIPAFLLMPDGACLISQSRTMG
jgi:hypothetical protein